MAKNKNDFSNIDLGFSEEDPLEKRDEFRLRKIDPYMLEENPENNKIYDIDKEEDEFLKEDIKNNGMHSPILIKKSDIHAGRFEIISGHRRTRIAKELGVRKIEAREIIAKTPEEKVFAEIMLITANSTQRDRKPSEKAREIQYLKTLIKDTSVDNVAAWLSKVAQMSERSIYRYEKLAAQPKEVQDAVDKGEISVTEAIGEKKPKKNVPKKIDINKASKKVYTFISDINSEIKSENSKTLDQETIERLRECQDIIANILN